jgi:Salmonella virulence plasmid 65kDa B protein/FG-GAP-like repeat
VNHRGCSVFLSSSPARRCRRRPGVLAAFNNDRNTASHDTFTHSAKQNMQTTAFIRNGVPVGAQVAVLLFAVMTATAQAQMSIPGTFAVSPTGAATYTIPIQVPPGIGGIEPKLALTYNSQAPNGPLGVGWNLAGLSTIRRCPQTLLQDNARTGVTYTAADRFCLDGARLMLTSGFYGTNGAEYRTEIDGVTKVSAIRDVTHTWIDQDGNTRTSTRDSFIVKTKDGLTMEYGRTADSNIISNLPDRTVDALLYIPPVTRLWAINRIYDSSGNTLKITYEQGLNAVDFPNGGFYPRRIDYTSNTNTGLAAASSVIFNHDMTRTDTGVSYEAGRSIDNRPRLSSITTQTNGATVHTYELNYEIGPASRRNRLASIRLTAPPGQGWLPRTSMTFPPEPAASAVVTQRNAPAADLCLSTCGSWKVLDVNGDGRSDLVHLKDNSGNVSVWLSNGDGTFTVSNFVSTDTALTTGIWQVLDLNGDGFADLLHLKDGSGNVSAWISTGTGQFTLTSYVVTDTALNTGLWQVLDVNGDGYADLVHLISDGNIRVWISNRNGSFSISSLSAAASVWNVGSGMWQVVDANADGLADLFTIGSLYASHVISNGNGTFYNRYYANPGGAVQSTDRWVGMDVNGDGLPDVVRLRPGQTSQSWISTGHHFPGTDSGQVYSRYIVAISSFGNSLDTGLGTGTWHLIDFNGDGLADLFHAPGATGPSQAYVWISDGKGGFTQAVAGTGDPSPNTGHWLSGDFTGDGVVDVVHMADDNGRYVVWSMPRASRDIPSSISNGLGNNVSWTSSTLPNLLNKATGSAYTRELPSVGDTFTVVPAISVVSGVGFSDGRGGTRHTTYTYDSARIERNGRGFLGFNWVQTTDALTGIVNRTYYRLDFPYLGKVKQTGRGTSATAWSNLELTVNDYACIDPASPSVSAPLACTVAAGKRYLVYPSRSVTTRRDLSGVALPQTEITNQNVDVFGNIGTTTLTTRDPGGSVFATKSVTNTYWNDVAKWYLGQVLVSTETSTGPDLPAPVRPGSGGLPAAPAPSMPPLSPAVLSVILNLLLND